MTSPSALRIDLAHHVTTAYTLNPKVKAGFVFGSAARGWADNYSDLEIAFVWAQPPGLEELQSAAQNAGANDWEFQPYDEEHQAWAEQFYLNGLKVEVAHWLCETIDDIIRDVVERYDVSQHRLVFEKQATVAALQHAVILHGEDTVRMWQSRLSLYPEELAIAMVKKHLQFSAFENQEMLARRNEIPLLYENHCAIVRRLLNLLFGLNRIYYPGFKWTRYVVPEMQIAPLNLFKRLERVFQADAVSGTHDLRLLIEETFTLVEQHLPQIDLKPQREKFNRASNKWPITEPKKD